MATGAKGSGTSGAKSSSISTVKPREEKVIRPDGIHKPYDDTDNTPWRPYTDADIKAEKGMSLEQKTLRRQKRRIAYDW